jgi:hypothetical protein
MKLRIRRNSIRVRVDRRDLAELLERGRVLDVLRFGPGSAHRFTYAVMIGAAPPGRPRADYAGGLLVITSPSTPLPPSCGPRGTGSGSTRSRSSRAGPSA